MEKNLYIMLAECLLPEDMVEYFDIDGGFVRVSVQASSQRILGVEGQRGGTLYIFNYIEALFINYLFSI